MENRQKRGEPPMAARPKYARQRDARTVGGRLFATEAVTTTLRLLVFYEIYYAAIDSWMWMGRLSRIVPVYERGRMP